MCTLQKENGFSFAWKEVTVCAYVCIAMLFPSWSTLASAEQGFGHIQIGEATYQLREAAALVNTATNALVIRFRTRAHSADEPSMTPELAGAATALGSGPRIGYDVGVQLRVRPEQTILSPQNIIHYAVTFVQSKDGELNLGSKLPTFSQGFSSGLPEEVAKVVIKATGSLVTGSDLTVEVKGTGTTKEGARFSWDLNFEGKVVGAFAQAPLKVS